jgi:hypothetical protein
LITGIPGCFKVRQHFNLVIFGKFLDFKCTQENSCDGRKTPGYYLSGCT